MKNFFDNLKDFCMQYSQKILFVILMAFATIFAVLLNYMENNGYVKL